MSMSIYLMLGTVITVLLVITLLLVKLVIKFERLIEVIEYRDDLNRQGNNRLITEVSKLSSTVQHNGQYGTCLKTTPATRY